MVKCLPEFEYFTVFLTNRKFISKINRSKVTDYAALTGLNPYAIELIFLTPASANKNGAFSYKVMRLAYTRGLIRFSNCAGLSRLT